MPSTSLNEGTPNTSCSEDAAELLRQCVAGEAWDRELVKRLGRDECADALFRMVAEGLADRFEPRLANDYAAIFSFLFEQVAPELRDARLLERYQRVRRPRACREEPDRVVVLSRVTLGADIAITSVVLDAARQRFPSARLSFAGSPKAFELFAGGPELEFLDVPYTRSGSVGARLQSWRTLVRLAADDQTVVVDPDSRLTQLGLLPVNDEARFLFFESRAYGGSGAESLTALTERWVGETFEVGSARNRIYPRPASAAFPASYATVSLGTGGNEAKRLSPALERELIRLLCRRFQTVVVDRGFGTDESARVERAVAGTAAKTFSGSFGEFAALIGGSSLYVGYDSAGQHAAASFGVPLVTIFRGFVNERMFARWQPAGPGPKRVLKIEGPIAIEDIERAVDSIL